MVCLIIQHRSTPNDRRIMKCIARRRSEYAAMIFAQSVKESHEPQPRTARAATLTARTVTARTVTANRTNRSRIIISYHENFDEQFW